MSSTVSSIINDCLDIFEDVRSTNIKMREEAESQIVWLESDIESKEEEIAEQSSVISGLEATIDDLKEQIARIKLKSSDFNCC